MHVVCTPSLSLSVVVLVAEVTQPSLGVGYEIGRAIDMKKKILCLFRPQSGRCEFCLLELCYNLMFCIVLIWCVHAGVYSHCALCCLSCDVCAVGPNPMYSLLGLSAMIRGADNGATFLVKDYSEEQVETVLQEYFSTL